MKSRHLLNLSVQNALDCLSEKFNLKNFPEGACSRNSLKKCATRSSDGRYRVHIATVYCISRSPLSQNPPVAPYLSPGLFISFSASHSVNCIGLKRYRFSPWLWWGWRTCSNALQITTDRGIRPLSEEVPCIWLYILMFFILHSETEREIRRPKTSTAGVNWLPPAGTIRIDPRKSLLPQQLYCIAQLLLHTNRPPIAICAKCWQLSYGFLI